jgi:putative ABC transport system substrate-binding protein
MRRREFFTLLGGAAVWPVAAQAQQPRNPVVGFLRPNKAEDAGHMVAALRQGLRESGYPADKVVMEFRWADDHEERLPKLAAELVALPVTAIVAGSFPAARAAKAATASIPIVFVTGEDPVTGGLVPSLNRPVGNITGVSFMTLRLSANGWHCFVSWFPKPISSPFYKTQTLQDIKPRPANSRQQFAPWGRKSLLSKPEASRRSMQPFRR